MEGHVRKRGEKWYYSFEAASVEGKRKRIERVGGRTKKEAEAALRKALEEYTGTGRHIDPSDQSYADYLDFYLRDYAENNCRPKTISFYNYIINKYIKPTWGHLPLKALTPAIIDSGYKKLKAQGVAQALMNSICTVTSMTLKKAVYPYQLIKDNPAMYTSRPRFDDPIDKHVAVIRPEEFNKIITRYPYNTTPYIPLMIAYHTGMRIGEILALTWDDIDFVKKKINVRKQIQQKDEGLIFTPTKTKSSARTVEIGDTICKVLNQHRKQQKENMLRYAGYYNVYYINGKTIYTALKSDINSESVKLVEFICTRDNGILAKYSTVAEYNKNISQIIGRPFKFHDLRHSHATLLLESGVELKTVSERLGHSSLGITADIYIETTETMAKRAVDIFESSVLPTGRK